MVENRFRQALARGDFAVTCEVIPGRGAREEAQGRVLEEAARIYGTGRVHALSITENPGGNPALLADEVAGEMLEQGIVPIVHFTCKDRSRNQMISQLYALERRGVENVLFMTGDYQATGWSGRARPVFDLDSVHVQRLAAEMNDGLVVPGRGGEVREKPAHFFNGGVVNPFKYLEGEAVPQYLKMEKKVLAGAQYLISQLGYDARKMDELVRYCSDRGCATPLIANVFVLTRGVAQLIRNGTIAGCYVSDELMAQLEDESRDRDKGEAARLERAAQQVAVARGLGYAGVHLGGFGVTADAVERILDRADELAPVWRDCALVNSYGKADGYYVYLPEHDADGLPTGLNAHERTLLSEEAGPGDVFANWELSRMAHYWALTPGERGNKLLAWRMDDLDRRKGEQRGHAIEHAGKSLLYGCVDCGDCGLEAALYSCPMAECPKCQRNGPCGGTADGWCEVHPGERRCIWYKAYHRARKSGEMERLTSYITPPNRWELHGASPWSAYTHRRDNSAARVPVSLGLDAPPLPADRAGAPRNAAG